MMAFWPSCIVPASQSGHASPPSVYAPQVGSKTAAVVVVVAIVVVAVVVVAAVIVVGTSVQQVAESSVVLGFLAGSLTTSSLVQSTAPAKCSDGKPWVGTKGSVSDMQQVSELGDSTRAFWPP